jgi:hypothetical protein
MEDWRDGKVREEVIGEKSSLRRRMGDGVLGCAGAGGLGAWEMGRVAGERGGI